MVDENVAELLVNQALNEIFRCLHQMTLDYKKIIKYGHRMIVGGKIAGISELLAIEEEDNTVQALETESTATETVKPIETQQPKKTEEKKTES